MVLGIGFSDFYKMCMAVMKMCYSKQNLLLLFINVSLGIFKNDTFIKDLVCENVCERVEVIDGLLPSPSVLWVAAAGERKLW